MSTKLIRVVAVLFVLMSAACGGTPAEAPAVNTDLKYSVSQEGYQVQFMGTPYEIAVDNCDGARDSTKIEERSQRYLAELNIEVSNKIAAEFGGNVGVAKAVLRDEIGIALGIRIGTETEARSSVEIVTPPGKKTVTTIQWKEVWTEGSIAIIRPDGSWTMLTSIQG